MFSMTVFILKKIVFTNLYIHDFYIDEFLHFYDVDFCNFYNTKNLTI